MHRHRACHQHQEHSRHDTEQQHSRRESLFKVHQKAKHNKHHNLQQPSNTIKECYNRALICKFVVSDYQARDIDRQVAVTLDD